MKNTILVLGLVSPSILTLFPACKSESAGTGGSGGGGGAGTGGSTGTGTTTGMGNCGMCYPQCFLDLLTPCTPSGACQQQGSGSNVDACYANGVKLSTTVSTTGATLTYYKSDGSVCFTADSTFSSTDVTATYKDASGATVLTDTTPLSGGAQTMTCGGKSYTVDPKSADCMACMSGMGSSCTQGTCTAP